MKLSAEEREALALQLVESLAPTDPLHQTWYDEIARRVRDMDAGRTRFMPADVALARLGAHIERCSA